MENIWIFLAATTSMTKIAKKEDKIAVFWRRRDKNKNYIFIGILFRLKDIKRNNLIKHHLCTLRI